MSAPTGSVWYCALCQRYVVLEGQPQRRRCRLCRKWMARTR